MEQFRRRFLLETLETLKNLQNNFRNTPDISDAERREILRKLHTIKGTARTFDFANSSRLAHELESVLSVKQNITNDNFKSLLTEGVKLLIDSFEQKEFEIPAQFSEKIHRNISQETSPHVSADFLPLIPPEIIVLLSRTEKTVLASALQDGNGFYCFEVGFELADFTEKFKELRGKLSGSGEIIAVLPGTKFNGSGQIDFRILFAGSAKHEELEKIAENYAAEIAPYILPESLTNNLDEILSKVVEHGKNLAIESGKEIEFEISAEKADFPGETLKIIFDILLHLIRNAVDHAIGKNGCIKIVIKAEANGCRLLFADDGCGVDLEKVKAKAIEKSFISDEDILTGQATLDLIFQSEFSTAPEITEISGRGIGLDAVKTAVENAGGKISVESQSGKGTTFDIFLPQTMQ